MSAHHTSWVLHRSEAKGSSRLVLLVLAHHANDQNESYPSVPTLVRETKLSRSTVIETLGRLDADSHVERVGPHPEVRYKGAIIYLLPDPWGGPDSGRGVQVTGSKGSGDRTQRETERVGRESSARASRDTSTPPPGFPDELRPHARHVWPILQDVAKRHAAREVTPYGLGAVIMAYPRRPLVRIAHELAAWSASGRQIRDVVATYSRWLAKADNLAATEPLPGAEPQGLPDGVTPLRGRSLREQKEVERRQRADRDMESIRRLQERQR